MNTGRGPSATSTDPGSRPAEYWDDRLRAHWGAHGVGSLAYGRHYNDWLYRVRKVVFRRLCRALDLPASDARILDVGCGTGFYVRQWLELGAAQVEGLDFSATAIERLRRTLPGATFRQADLGRPGMVQDGDLHDVVSAFDVLFHIVDDRRYEVALGNIAAALRPDGWFLYSDNFVHGPGKQFGGYWRSRSLALAEAAVRQAGFEIHRRVPMFALMNSPADSRWRYAERLWEAAMKPVRRSEIAGFLWGAVLFPIEITLLRFLSEGPSTEIMVCRKL
jgi:SAM-dependent methyltransferase